MNISFKKIEFFQFELNKWGKTNIKKYPWRYVDDAYMILVSEFMLHRTQVLQVVPIYEEFIRRYPDLDAFGQTNEEDVSLLLQSLGLRWRIERMIAALQEIKLRFGEVPQNYNDLISIPGIGPYIAGATVCFSSNQEQVLIDTNVVRVIGRIYNLSLHGEARRRKDVFQTIERVMDRNSPRDFYYAIIDLAHTICRPKVPNCGLCPIKELCGYAITTKPGNIQDNSGR
ncbi:MAG: hypothetical protein Q7U53_17355 [Anaerolineaceae bacterium]|nr:hypothetical protein [Anaerolineaceae bacterium]